jgi:hypothetical protein
VLEVAVPGGVAGADDGHVAAEKGALHVFEATAGARLADSGSTAFCDARVTTRVKSP